MQKTPYVTKGGNYLVPVPFGKGDVDFGRIGASLVRHGYDGYLALEFDRVRDISEVASGIDAVCSSFLI